MNDTEQIQINRFLATELRDLGEQDTLVGIKSSKIIPKFLLTNDTDPLDSEKRKKFLFYDSGGESSIKVNDGPTSYSYTGYLEMSHMLNVFKKLGIGEEKKYTPRLKNVTLNELISTYFKNGVHIYFKAGDLVLVSNDTPVELRETDVPNPSLPDAIDITNVYNLMGLVGKKGEDGKYKFKKKVTDYNKLRYTIHFTIGEQFIFRNDLISVSESEDTILKAEEEYKNKDKTTYSIKNKDGQVLYFGTKQLTEIGDMDSIYTKSLGERKEFYTNVYKDKSFGNTNINIHNFADYCNENVFKMKNLNEIKSEIDIQLQLQKESAQTETQIYYTTSLDDLFSQDFDKPNIFYSPEERIKLTVRPNYYRKYTASESKEVTVELPNKIYTREMRTAIVKRWLQIKHYEAQDASNGEVTFELIPIENEMNSQLVSILFHLINMNFEKAYRYFKEVNNIILNSRDLIEWLPNEFKKSIQRDPRRDIMKFKYFHNRITKRDYTEKEVRERLLNEKLNEKLEEKNPLNPENTLDFQEFLKLIGKTKRLIDYNEKKKLVAEYFELFKKITSNLVHIEYFQDLDYFFIVFEMLIDTSNKAVKQKMESLVMEFKYKGPPIVSTRARPSSLSAKGGSKKHSKKMSFNKSSKKTKKISYN